MRRRPGKRSELSAHDKKSNRNPHLSDEQLLVFLDGELPQRETAQAEAHLAACWSCRVRREQIGEVITDVVAYRDCLIEGSVPLSAGARTIFVAQFRQLVQSMSAPTLGSRILGLLRTLRTFSQGQMSQIVPRHVWISVIALIALTVLLFTRFGEVPRVSASQFLANAQASEARALHGVTEPVVYQKLRIRIGSEGVTRTIYHDLDGKRRVDYLDSSNSSSGRQVASNEGPVKPANRLNASRVVDADLQQTFRTARLNWEDPLSPTSYDAWHDSLSQKQDEVTQITDEFLTLKTTTAEGPIKEASITVRTADFHPVAEDLRLQDAQVEVTELAWQIIPMEAIDPAIFARAPSAVVVRPTLPIPPGPTDAELAEAELQARVALHAEEADLGEQIEFDRKTPNHALQRSLLVRGIVSTSQRRAELSDALRGIPHVELQLQTIEEAALQEKNQLTGDKSESTAMQEAETSNPTRERAAQEPDAQGANGPKPIPGDVAVSKPALERQLEERFPNSEERVTFVNNAVELAQDCLAQAWALRRLRDRYTPEEVALLSYGSKQTLELLVHDHASELRQRVDAARDLVLPLLPPEPTDAVPPPDAPASAAEPANDWRSAVTEIFPKVQTVAFEITALFAGPGEAVSDRKARVRDLQLALAELETQLPVFWDFEVQ